MTMTQRLQCEAILGQQQGNVSQIRTMLEILKKTALSEDERKALDIKFENGSMLWKEDPAEVPVEIALDDAEAAKLKEVLTTWPSIRTFDMRWLDPLLEQL
jgi:hypothetical protein